MQSFLDHTFTSNDNWHILSCHSVSYWQLFILWYIRKLFICVLCSILVHSLLYKFVTITSHFNVVGEIVMQKTTICCYCSTSFSHLHLHSLQRRNHKSSSLITYTTFLCSRNASNKSIKLPDFLCYFFSLISLAVRLFLWQFEGVKALAFYKILSELIV